MIDDKGRYRCDCEVGSVKRKWRTCGKPAVIQSQREYHGKYYTLEFCEQHREKATSRADLTPSIIILATTNL